MNTVAAVYALVAIFITPVPNTPNYEQKEVIVASGISHDACMKRKAKEFDKAVAAKQNVILKCVGK